MTISYHKHEGKYRAEHKISFPFNIKKIKIVDIDSEERQGTGRMNKEVRLRLERLRTQMERAGIDYYLISSSDFHHSEYVHEYFKARQYFSGFTGSNGTLVVGKNWAGLWTDGRYFVQAHRELEGTGITLYRMQEEGVPDIPQFLQIQMKQGQTLGFDGRTVSCREGRRLEKALEGQGISLMVGQDLAGESWQERPSLPCYPVSLLSTGLSGKGMADKLKEIRKALKAAGAEYLLLSQLDDLMWLLNIRGRDIAYCPVALCHGFVTMTQVYVFLQKEAVTDAFREYAQAEGIIWKDYHEITHFVAHYPYEGSVMLDEKSVSYSLYSLVAQRAACINRNNPTELFKAVKNETELERIRQVYLKDSVQLIRFIYWLKKKIGKEEITEVSAGSYLDRLRSEAEGFLDFSFPTICAYGENAAMMHYQADESRDCKLEAAGMLLVDSGGQYMGGTTDVTRTIVLGAVEKEIKRQFTAVVSGMLRLSHSVFLSGCTGRNLDILARLPLWELGIDYKCGTGHGIGYMLNVHEGPQNIRWRYSQEIKEEALRPGMLLSNEPGVYQEGSHGIRIENIMVVQEDKKTQDGQFLAFETLTYVPIDREAILLEELQPMDRKRLNDYHQEVYQKTAPYLAEEERKWLAEVTAPL